MKRYHGKPLRSTLRRDDATVPSHPVSGDPQRDDENIDLDEWDVPRRNACPPGWTPIRDTPQFKDAA